MKMKRAIPALRRAMIEALESRQMLSAVAEAAADTLISDGFNATSMDPNIWHIPNWYLGATYYGHTQNPCQPAALPDVENGEAQIGVQTYNWSSVSWNPSYFGDRIISNAVFTPEDGLHLTARLRVPVAPGTIAAVYFYLPQGVGDPANNNQELDFEFLGIDPYNVHINVYGGEPLGVGHPQIVPLPNGGRIDEEHTYEIKYTVDDGTTFLVDGQIVATDSVNKLDPDTQLTVQLGHWVDNPNGFGYDPSLPLPTTDPSANQRWNMFVDSVTLTTLPNYTNFVKNLYLDVLGRPADAAGLAGWTGVLTNGTLGPSDVAGSFLGSTENFTREVRGLYQSVLGRSADDAAVPGWVSYRASHSYEQVETLFYASREHVAAMSPVDLVNSYYVAFFGRQAEPAGLAGWSGLIENGTPASVVVEDLLSSDEGLTGIVRNAYGKFLHRAANPTGIDGWTDYLKSGATSDDLALAFTTSLEYLRRDA